MPASSVHPTLRAPAEIAEALDKIARHLERDRSWVMLRAVRHYLDGEGREVIEDAEAIARLIAARVCLSRM